MNAVDQFNGLHGAVADRNQLQHIMQLAQEQEQNFVYEKLSKLLENNPEEKSFKISIKERAFEVAPESFLNCLDCDADFTEEELEGLGRITPTDVYQLITDKMIAAIKQASGREYKKKWKDGYVTGADGKPLAGFLIPHNFVTKKPYRGINLWLLSNLDGLQVLPLENPFYLTFKQIENLGGKLKKGSKGREVVFFSFLYKIKNDKLDFGTYDKDKFIDFLKKNGFTDKEIQAQLVKSKIPFLRYYNVFNGSDVEGIDFKLDQFKVGYVQPEIKGVEQDRNEIAELIIKNYPDPKPKYQEGNSNRAFYQPGADLVRMPHFNSFETSQDYYRTLFHEYIHSTGSDKRLGRDFSGEFGSIPYAKEELVAEFGSVFLSAQAGIIWHSNKNHAEYIKSWHNVLGIIEEDNRFLMRAATEAQKAADFILQVDEEGEPLYLKQLAKSTKSNAKVNGGVVKKTKDKTKDSVSQSNKKTQKTKDKTKVSVSRSNKKPVQLALFGAKKQLAKPNNPLVIPMSEEPDKNVEFYKVPGDFGKFLGNVEVKPFGSVAVTLDAPQGSGKTRFFYYMMDLFASKGYRCLFVSLEEHPLSELAQAKKREYIRPDNIKNIDTVGELPNGYKDLEGLIPYYDIIFIDSWGKVTEIQKIDFDKALRKRFNSKLFFVIFQRTVTGTMRGGSASQFDGDIIMKLEKDESEDYKLNYAYFDKNRYQSIELNKLKFNTYSKKLIAEKKVKPKTNKKDE